MANKKQSKSDKLSLDDYDFGSEFDFDEFDMKPKPLKGKRDAIERIGMGALEGVGETLKSPSFFRAMIKKALPRGYGDMLDIADQSATTIRELYNEGVQELKPAIKDLARTTEKLMPSVEQYLPKAATATLKGFIEANKDYARVGGDPKTLADMAVTNMMAETFKYTSNQDARREAKQDIKDRLGETIAHDRHQDDLAQLDGIRRGVVQMAAYQAKVEYGFHRKSLELQMRHYFVAVDTLNEQKRQNTINTEHLAGILNNTALPDFVKLKTSERVKDMLRNKFINNLQDGIFNGRTNYVQNLGKAIRSQAIDGVKGFASGISAGAQGGEALQDANEMVSGFGVDKFQLAGQQVGSWGAETLGGLAGGRLKKVIGGTNNKYGKAVRSAGNKLQYAAQNAPQILNDFSNKRTDAQTYAEQAMDSKLGNKLPEWMRSGFTKLASMVGDPVLDVARGTIKRANQTDTQVKQEGLGELNTASMFTNKAHKSLVEIIPGYLARIYQELQITRTGDTSIDLAQYDYSRNAFSTTKAVRKSVFGKLFNKDAKAGVQREQDRLVDMIDPEGQLTKEQRKILGSRLMGDNLGKRSGYETGRISNYTNDYNFSGNEQEKKHAGAFSDLFKKLDKKDKASDHKLSLDFSDRFSETGRSMNDNRALVQQLLEIYPRDTLESMKILKPGSNAIDMEQMQRYFDGEEHEVAGIPALGGLRSNGRGSRQIQGPQHPHALNPSTAAPELVDPPAMSGTAAEIKKLIDIIEQQNTKPLISEIKDILSAMKEATALAEGSTDSTSDSGPTLGESLQDARRRMARGALRVKRRGLVAGQRAITAGRGLAGRVGSQLEDFADEHDLRGRAESLRDRAQEAWRNRPTAEQVRVQVGAGWDRTRDAGVAGANRVRQGFNDLRARNAAGEVPEAEKSNGLLTEIKDTLLAIKERLEDGILTQGMPADGTLPQTGGSRRSLGSRLNFRLTDVAKGIWKIGKGTAKLGGSVVNGLVGGTAKLAWGLGIGAAKLVGGIGSNIVNGQYRRARGFVDIYVGNEETPRMYARMLQEGNVYFDKATGKPIRNLKMITGTVIKKTANGEEVVLDETEVEQAWCREGIVKKSLKAMGAVVKLTTKVTKGVIGAVLGGVPLVYRLGFSVLKKAFGLTDLAQDIFVKDRLDSPAMTAMLMRAGSYHSAISGKTITKPSHIDGPVLIGEETVLTHDDLLKGLVDKNNRPIRTGWAKLASIAFGGVGKVLRLAKKIAGVGTDAVASVARTGWAAGKKLVNGAINIGGAGFDMLRGKNPFATMAVASEKTNQALLAGGLETNNYLKQILDLLRERMPGKKKHADQDVDGDGIRDGSYEDQMKHKKAAEAAAEVAPGAPKAGVNAAKGGGLLAGAKGLWNKLRGKKTDEDGNAIDGGDINIGGGGGAGGPAGPPKPKGPGFKDTKGVWGKAKYLAKAGGKGLWGAAKWAGKGALALAGLEGLGIGGGLMTGAAGLASGAATAGTAIAAGAGAVATGIGAVLTAPVLLGALAVAALGVGAYYGYKYLTKRRLGLLSRVRYVQYGFSPTDDDHVAAVFGLEDKLRAAVIYGKDGATMDGKKVDALSLFKDFDVTEDDKPALENWLSWFANRFKPVFLTHLTALKAATGDKWLDAVDKDLEPAQQVQYFNAIKFPDGPYGASTSPFKDLKELPSGSGDVKAIISLVDIEMIKIKKDASKAGVAGGAAAAAGLGIANPVSELNKAPTATPEAPGLNPNVLSDATKGNINTSGLGAMGGKTSLAGSGLVLEGLGTSRLDAIDAVRLKSYGLVKMELDKVKSIMILEKDIENQINFSGGIANWSGSLEQILKANAPAFGVDTSDDAQAKRWLTWFNRRFLPVYLNYATLIKAQTGKDKPSEGKDALKPNQQLDLATALYTTSSKSDGGSNSVWQILDSPWAEYALNADVKSVEGNIQGLKELAKNTVLSEPGGSVPNQPSANKGAANSGAATAPAPTGFLGGLWNKAKFLVGAGGGAGTGFSSGPPVGGGAGTAGGGEGFGGGREMTHPGKGSGGDINDIPAPKGNKSWNALKDTILGASKMVGVDPQLMAVMAALESGFDYTVKAGTSTATGLYQFIDGTWKSMLKKFGPKYGIDPNTSQRDPRANALMGAEYIKDNMAALSGKVNRPLTDTDVYFAHFLGSGGAKKFLTADPNAIAANLLPEAAAANKSIFYKDGNPLTVSQVYQLVNQRVRNKATGFGISVGGGEEMTSSTPTTPGKDGTAGLPAAGGGQASTDTPATSATGTPAKPTAQGIGAPSTTSAPAAAGSPAVKPTTAGGASAPTTTDVAAGVQVSTFVPPTRKMADVAQQGQMQSEVRVSNLSETNTILTDTLAQHKLSHDVLKTIAAALTGSAAAAAEPAASSPQAARAAQRKTQGMPSAPVSVAKPAYN